MHQRLVKERMAGSSAPPTFTRALHVRQTPRALTWSYGASDVRPSSAANGAHSLSFPTAFPLRSRNLQFVTADRETAAVGTADVIKSQIRCPPPTFRFLPPARKMPAASIRSGR